MAIILQFPSGELRSRRWYFREGVDIMEPRLRAGLITGSGAALAMIFLGAIGSAICGPFLAIGCGLSAGMQVVRDPRVRLNFGSAGALAGLWAGLVLGIGQVIGTVLPLTTSDASIVYSEVRQYYPGASDQLIWIFAILAGVIFALLDIGITVVCGTLIASNLAKRNVQVLQSPTYPQYPPPVYTPPAAVPPIQPPIAAQQSSNFPPPPAVYPPPPGYYGLPDTIPEQESTEATNSEDDHS
jgi:hypothetical protein